MGVDWTAAMRASPRVLEYVLVGETDDGICGQPWATWGYDGGDACDHDTDDDEEGEELCVGKQSEDDDEEGEVKGVAPYERDGFERVDLADVSAAGQVCRTDERWRRSRQSRTVSFRRVAR